MMMWLWFSIGT